MILLHPGAVIDGTPEEVAEVLREAPVGTVVSDCDGDAWQRLLSDLHPYWSCTYGPSSRPSLYAPLTVLRWGRELPTPVDVQADQ